MSESRPKTLWLAVHQDSGVLSQFVLGLGRGFVAPGGPMLGFPLGFASEAGARALVDDIDFEKIDKTRFAFVEVASAESIPTAEEMDAAGIDPKFTAVFARDREPSDGDLYRMR